MAHKDVVKYFSAKHPETGETRFFKAVGFLGEEGSSLKGRDVLRHVPEVIGQKDDDFLDACYLQDWSRDLWSYCLITNMRYTSCCFIKCYDRNSVGWFRRWTDIDDFYGKDVLVLCPCSREEWNRKVLGH